MEKREASRTIMGFMGKLAIRYDSREMRRLWEALGVMRSRYGDLFVAAAIRKDEKDAELALHRYWIQNCSEETTCLPEEPAEPTVRWHHAYPKQKSIAKRLIALLLAGLLAVTLMSLAMTQMATDHSDEIIARADRTISRAGGR